MLEEIWFIRSIRHRAEALSKERNESFTQAMPAEEKIKFYFAFYESRGEFTALKSFLQQKGEEG